MASTILVASAMFDVFSSRLLSDMQVRVALFAAFHGWQLRDDGFADSYGERFRLDLEIHVVFSGISGL